jgi:heptosyltransferase III
VSVGRWFHRVEVWCRPIVGALLGAMLFRPWRKGFTSQLASARRVVIVRLDNRVGEALLTTPLIRALAQQRQVDCVVHPKCVRVLEGLAGVREIRGFLPRWFRPVELCRDLVALRKFCDGALVLNAANWQHYSGTHAIVARLLAPKSCVIAPAVGATRFLCDVAVTPRLDTDNEALQRLQLAAPLNASTTAHLSFRTPRPSDSVRQWVEALPQAFAVVNAGSRLVSRRIPTQVFAHAASVLKACGLVPVLTWGPNEEVLALDVAKQVEGAVVAPKTDLDDLAFAMQRARVVVCNNTGPMHLAVAVGAPTCALFYTVPVSRWGHQHAPHEMVVLDGLPSVDEMMMTVEQRLRSMLGKV